MDLMYDVPGMEDVSEISITADVINGTGQPIFGHETGGGAKKSGKKA